MSSSWGYAGGISLATPSVDGIDTRPKKKAAPQNPLVPACWGRRKAKAEAATSEDDATEPFRCNEPQHKTASQGPRVRWFSLGSRFDKGHRDGETECCGQLMELLPSDVAATMKKPKPKYRKPEAEEPAT